MCQNVPQILPAAVPTFAGSVNHVGGYVAGDTVLAVTFAVDVVAGSWITIAGDDTPLRVTTVVGSPATSLTVSTGLKRTVANGAVITVVTPGAVNLAAGYAAGYEGSLVVDGLTMNPVTGQIMSLGADYYGAIPPSTTTSLTLNSSLQAAVANNDVIGIGPAGTYNLALCRNALTLVCRPVALTGSPSVKEAVVSDPVSGLSIRYTEAYEPRSQKTIITLDMLCGTKVLDVNQGAVMLA